MISKKEDQIDLHGFGMSQQGRCLSEYRRPLWSFGG